MKKHAQHPKAKAIGMGNVSLCGSNGEVVTSQDDVDCKRCVKILAKPVVHTAIPQCRYCANSAQVKIGRTPVCRDHVADEAATRVYFTVSPVRGAAHAQEIMRELVECSQ